MRVGGRGVLGGGGGGVLGGSVCVLKDVLVLELGIIVKTRYFPECPTHFGPFQPLFGLNFAFCIFRVMFSSAVLSASFPYIHCVGFSLAGSMFCRCCASKFNLVNKTLARIDIYSRDAVNVYYARFANDCKGCCCNRNYSFQFLSTLSLPS